MRKVRREEFKIEGITYVTKWVLTRGIEEWTDAKGFISSPTYIRHPDPGNFSTAFLGKDAFPTLREAIEDALKKLGKKSDSLLKQKRKIDALRQEYQKALEDSK